MCADVCGCRRRGRVCKLACMMVARCWRRPIYGIALLFVTIATAAAAALVCLFVMLFVVIDLFVAALAACFCGWLIRSARHGTADNGDGHGDDATRLPACVWRRVLGGFGGRPLGRAQDVRSCLDLATWSAGVWVLDCLPEGSCWWRPRRWRPRCCGAGGRAGGCAVGNAVCSRYFVVVIVVADVCGCQPAGSGM
jgi:hypothetical protein